MIRRPPRSTRTDTLFPYTTLFRSTEQALFGEASYDVTDALRLTIGGRLYRTKVEGTLEASGLSGGNNGATPGPTAKGWRPKVALPYQPWRDLMLYRPAEPRVWEECARTRRSLWPSHQSQTTRHKNT